MHSTYFNNLPVSFERVRVAVHEWSTPAPFLLVPVIRSQTRSVRKMKTFAYHDSHYSCSLT